MKIILSLIISLLVLSSPSYINRYDDGLKVNIEKVNSIENPNVIETSSSISFFLKSNYLFNIPKKANTIFYDLQEFNDQLYVVYVIDNTLYLQIYKENGKTSLSKTFDVNDVGLINNSNVKINVNEKGIEIFCTCIKDTNTNVLLITLPQVTNYNTMTLYEYGGIDNEELLDFISYKDKYYIVINKDGNTNSDFKTLKGLILALISDKKIEAVTSFKSKEYKYINLHNDTLYLSFNDSAFTFDLDLNQLDGMQSNDETILTLISVSGLLLKLDYTNLYIYNLYNPSDLFYEEDLTKKMNFISKVIVFDDFIYLYDSSSYYKLNVIDTRQTVKELIYQESLTLLKSKAYNLFTELKKTYDENILDASINGEYYVPYSFLDKYGISQYDVELKVTVLAYENVIEGMTYPINYNLFYVGVAFLNDKMIENNFELTESGDYTLVIYDKDKVPRTIHFKVSSDQLNFKSYNVYTVEYDNEIRCGDSAIVLYDIDLEGYTIKEILVNNNNFYTYTYKNKVLELVFTYSDSGLKREILNQIIVCKDEKLYSIYLNEEFDIHVLEKIEMPTLLINEKENNLVVNVNSQVKCLAGISIYLDDELSYSGIIKNMNFKEISSKNKTMRICLQYIVGASNIHEEEIMYINLGEDKLEKNVYINIIQKVEEEIEFKISISKNIVESIYINNNEAYLNSGRKVNSTIYVVVFASIAISTILIYFVFIKKMRQTP